MATDQAETTNYKTGLLDSIQRSGRYLQGMNRQRVRMMKHYAGPGYANTCDGYDSYSVQYPNPDMFNTIFSLLPLFTVDPDPYISPKSSQSLRNFSSFFSEVVRVAKDRAEMGEKMEEAALNQTFGFAALYTGVKEKNTSAALPNPEGETRPDIDIFIENLNPSDVIYDITAVGGFNKCKFIGHIQRLPRQAALDDSRYNDEDVWAIPSLARSTSAEDDSRESELGVTNVADATVTIYDDIGLLHLFLPREMKTVTIPWVGGDTFTMVTEGDVTTEKNRKDGKYAIDRVLWEAKWAGPPTGPYTIIAPLRAPNSVIPISFADLSFPMADMKAAFFKKMTDRAFMEKDLVLAEGSETVRNNLAQAPDGSILDLPSMVATKDVKIGGITQPMLAGHALIDGLYKNIMVNQGLLGGTELPSETYRSNQLLANASSGKVQILLKANILGAIDIFSKIGFYLLKTNAEFEVIMQVGELEVPHLWNDKVEKGEFDDFVFDVKSRVSKSYTGEDDYNRAIKYLNEAFMPMAGIAAQQGKLPNVEAIQQDLSEMVGLGRMAGRWFKDGEALEAPGVASNAGSSSRNVNVSGQGGQVPAGDLTEAT